MQFERGTISYALSSTLTRPATIAPTVSCERKIYVLEPLDIALLSSPKPRVITLKSSKKQGKAKSQSKTTASESNDRATALGWETPGDSPRPDRSTNQDVAPDSRSVSEFSTTSAISGSSISFDVTADSASTNDIQSAECGCNERTAKAKIDLLRSGYLPGDKIPVKVHVQHTRPIRSINGVIVTLFRKGRIDPHPLLPIGPARKGRAVDFDDYYPKSRTGLGGLSFSAATSSHTFRMELDQKFEPMYINPQTLDSEIKTAVRVPEEAFPTINCVPGSMICFTYHIEVVMDLSGKLSTADGIFPRMNLTGSSTVYALGQRPRHSGFGVHGSPEVHHFIDTAELRREKSVAHTTFDVVIGSKDSQRRNVRRPPDPWEKARQLLRSNSQSEDNDQNDAITIRIGGDSARENRQRDGRPSEIHGSSPTQANAASAVLPPAIEEPVDEKSRLRRMEERLLPSAPADAYPSSSTGPPQPQPSAPTLDELEESYDTAESRVPTYPGLSAPALELESLDMPADATPVKTTNPRAAEATDDKQELERQRLLASASSPDNCNEDFAADVAESSFTNAALPTAPVFEENDSYRPTIEDDELIGHMRPTRDRMGPENLPRYHN